MPDISHWFGNDFETSATGDLLLSADIEQTNQRIVRRLSTIEGEYCWHPDYGASLPLRVGLPSGAFADEDADNNLDAVAGVSRNQMYLEAAVAKTPEPSITVEPILNGAFISIKYIDGLTGDGETLDFEVLP